MEECDLRALVYARLLLQRGKKNARGNTLRTRAAEQHYWGDTERVAPLTADVMRLLQDLIDRHQSGVASRVKSIMALPSPDATHTALDTRRRLRYYLDQVTQIE